MRFRLFTIHMTVVSAAGAVALVWMTLHTDWARTAHPGALLVLAGLLILSEQRPLTVIRRQDRSAITLSAVFACAILLRWEIGVAVAAQVLASLLEDLRSRRAWWKSAFNIGQYTLSLAAAGLAYHGIYPGSSAGRLDHRTLGAAVVAGAVFFAVNTLLTGTAVATSEGVSLPRLLAADLGFQASVNGTMAGLAPVVLAVVDESLWLVPLLLLPAAAVYRGGRLALEKEHRDRHDALTDLPNRLAFGEEVGLAISEAAGGADGCLAVVVMDVDGFRDLNDTLGHSAGDHLLAQVADRLAGSLGPGATLARLGGDEFGILLPSLARPADAAETVRRLAADLAEPFEVDGVSIDVRASAGIALFPEHGRAGDELLQHADVAMYLAKRRKSGYETYQPERNQHSRRRLTLLNELRSAISTPSLVLHYQPKADMHSGQICGLEALLRWPHPELGMIPPSEFVALAEQTSLIRPLTEFVLDQACSQLACWHEEGVAVPVAVNVSANVVQDAAFPVRVRQRLERFGIPSDLLVIELTETTIMADPEASLSVLVQLAEMGVRLSIDDFGTGYSSLAYLSRLPVSEVKIDSSFVTHVDTQEGDRVIVESTIELGRNLGLTVVAEGVETIPVWQTLARLGCGVAQGYLVARPEPEPLVTAMLRRGISAPLVEEFAVSFGLNRSAHGPRS